VFFIDRELQIAFGGRLVVSAGFAGDLLWLMSGMPASCYNYT